MSPKMGQLQITNPTPGKAITGKQLWLHGYETVGAFELETGTALVAVKLLPGPGSPDFTEPVIVMLAVQDIDDFFKAIRIAEAGLHPDVRQGGIA
jgi:hypothetical protein